MKKNCLLSFIFTFCFLTFNLAIIPTPALAADATSSATSSATPAVTSSTKSGTLLQQLSRNNQKEATFTIPADYAGELSATKDQYSLSFIPKQADLSAGASAKAETSDNTLLYRDVQPETNIIYQALNYGLKESIVLKSASSPKEFSWQIRVSENLTIKRKGQSLAFFDKLASPATSSATIPQNTWPKEKIFEIPAPFMVDSKGNRSENVKVEIKQGVLTLTADQEWLKTASYPVVIDPTIVYNTSAQFANGTYNRLTDTGSGSSPNLTTNYRELPTDANTIALWHLNETSGNALDSSGNSNTGTPTGTTVVPGILGKARSFNGTSDYISAPAITNLGTTFTVEGWFYFNALATSSSDQRLIMEGNWVGGTQEAYDLYQGYGGGTQVVSFRYSTNGTSSGASPAVTSTTSFATGHWYHIAGVRDGSNLYLYVNGKLDATASGGSTSPVYAGTAPLLFGKLDNNSQYFNGVMDEFRISNVARTPEEIKADATRFPYSIYTSDVQDFTKNTTAWNPFQWNELGVGTGDGETLKDTTGLVAQWNFNSTSGTTATADAGSCGSTCNGTLTNFASTASQDAAPGTGWTTENARWPASTPGALMFDGTDDYVSCTDANCGGTTKLDYPGSGGWSFGAWVQKKAGVSPMIISKGMWNDSTGWKDLGYYLKYETTYNRYETGLSGTGTSTTSLTSPYNSYNDSSWHYVVSTYDGANLKLYVDGALAASTAYSGGIYNSAQDFRIGAFGHDGGVPASWWNGAIDSSFVMARTMTPAEILSNYNAGNIELQTRVGNTSSPDGTWEAWKPVTGETTIASMDTDAANWAWDSSATYMPKSQANESTIKMEGIGSLKLTTGAPQVDANTIGLWHLDETSGTGAYLKNSSIPTINITDSFNRANNSSTLGNADTGQTWTYQNAAVGITGNQAYVVTGCPAPGYALTDAGTQNGSLQVTNAIHAQDARFVFRYVDSQNMYWLEEAGAQYQIDRMVGGTRTTLQTWLTTPANGDIIRIELNGSSIKAFINGTERISVTDNNVSGTKYGFGAWCTTSMRFDDFSFSNSTINSNGTPTGTSVVDGFYGKARRFSGTGEYATTSLSGMSNNKGTIEEWVRPVGWNGGDSTMHGSFQTIAPGNWVNQIGQMIIINQWSNNVIYFRIVPDAGCCGLDLNVNTTGLYKDLQWTHLAFTWDQSANNISAYVNGVLAASRDFPTAVTTPLNPVGYMGIGHDAYWKGDIDEFKISKVARSADEISESYRAGRDHRLSKTISSTDLSAKTKLPFYVASDRQGQFLEATVGNNAFVNYEPDANTVGLWHMEENYTIDGSSAAKAGRSCYSLKLDGVSSSGIYWIDPDGFGGNAAFQAYCDMTTDGGGWTILISHPASGSTQNPLADYGTVSTVSSFSMWSKNTVIPYNQMLYKPLYNANLYAEAIKGVNGWSAPVAFKYTDTAGTVYNYTSTAQVYLTAGAPVYSNACSGYTPNGGYGLVLMEFPPGGWCTHTGYAFGLSGGDMRGCHDDSWMWNWGNSPGGALTCPDPAQFKAGNALVGLRDTTASADYVIKDSTGYSNNGQSVGTILTQGKLGKARSFNGSSDKITFANPVIGANSTVEMWIKPNANLGSTGQGLFDTNPGAAGALRIYGTGAGGLNYGNGGCNLTISIGNWTNQWHHVVLTISGSINETLYIDGSSAGSGTATGCGSTSSTFILGNFNSANWFNGIIDEVRISNVARSADDIRAAYEVSKRTHPIIIDFKASLDSGNLIADTNDLSFTIDSTKYGAQNKGDNLYKGDKVIVKENVGGTEYIAQGTVTAITPSSGAVTVLSWDAGSTFPTTGFSIYATVFKWQREYFDLTGSLPSQRNAVTRLTLRMTDGSQGANIWLDDFKSNTNYLTTPAGSTILSSLGNRYFQYRAILTSTDTNVSPSLASTTTDYITNVIPAAPTLSAPSNTATGQILAPVFTMSSTDDDSDILKYKLQIDTANTFNTGNLRTLDMTSSTTDWSAASYASGATASYTVPGSSPLTANTAYYWRAYAIDQAGRNLWGSVSSIYSFTTNAIPNTPILNAPTNAASNQALIPILRLAATDINTSDYLKYKIQIDTVNTFGSGNLQTFDQTSSQTGWSGQNAGPGGNTAYTQGTQATFTVPALLLENTQYYWRAYAIDPTGANTWSDNSATSFFTTSHKPNKPSLVSPTDTAASVVLNPLIKISAWDTDSDYLRYKIELCTNLAMTVGCQTFDQTANQTGWSGQNAQGVTAYTSNTAANYFIQTSLAATTTYYWRAYAIDPGGANSWSTTQTTPYSFTTKNASGSSACYIDDSGKPTQATAHWSDMSSSETGYQLEKNIDSGAFGSTQNLAANTTTYTDTTSANHLYQYRIRATFTGGEYSDWCVTPQVNYTQGTLHMQGVKFGN